MAAKTETVSKKPSNKIDILTEPEKSKKLLFIFIVGSIFGCYYEMVLNLVRHAIYNHEFFWETRSGVLYGPFSVIYGLGAVLMVLLLARKKFSWWQIVVLGGLVGGAFEFTAGLFQEIVSGTRSWDYSSHWLNFGGRTSFFIMLGWGLACLILVRVVFPPCCRLVDKIPKKISDVLFWSLLIFLSIDCLLSLSAVVKMNLRRHNVPTYTPYGQFLDTVYDDERVHRAYPNMVNIN